MNVVTAGRLFEKLERQKRTVLSRIGGLTAEELSFRPHPASWSVLNVLDHLVKVERASFQEVQRQLPRGTTVNIVDRVRAKVVIGVMLSPIRVKVPDSAAVVWPGAAPDLPRIAADWSNVRVQMAGFLDSLKPRQSGVGVFRHPVSGWMTVNDTLAFLSAHLRHHEYQLDRLRCAPTVHPKRAPDLADRTKSALSLKP